MSAITVHQVGADDVVEVRWEILRPGFPRESAVFDGDRAIGTFHFGALAEGRLVGVASIYTVPMPERPEIVEAFQLRGMATLPEVRGCGAGRVLLAACEDGARTCGARLIWCNARVSAAGFYRRHGWQALGAEFDIPTVGPHYRMFRQLA